MLPSTQPGWDPDAQREQGNHRCVRIDCWPFPREATPSINPVIFSDVDTSSLRSPVEPVVPIPGSAQKKPMMTPPNGTSKNFRSSPLGRRSVSLVLMISSTAPPCRLRISPTPEDHHHGMKPCRRRAGEGPKVKRGPPRTDPSQPWPGVSPKGGIIDRGGQSKSGPERPVTRKDRPARSENPRGVRT